MLPGRGPTEATGAATIGDVSTSRSPTGLGGVIRQVPEDFFVEEIPLVRPTGRGEHVIFQLEKRGLSTFDAVLRVSKGAKVSEHAVNYAGLKDARAVTRQYMSARRIAPERLLGIRHPNVRILSANRHPSSIKLGHHRGNRFTIRIRNVDPSGIPNARRELEAMTRAGMPNGYGAQRFGIRLDGHRIGQAVVDEDWPLFLAHLLGRPSPLEGNPRIREARAAFDAGDFEKAQSLFPMKHRAEKKALSTLLRTGSPREVFMALGKRPRRIWIAAWQSYLFNRILERREEAGTHHRLLPGDIACLEGSGAFFPVPMEGPLPPADIRAVPTAPLVGYDLTWADGEPGRIEREVLAREGAEPESFRADHVRTRGNRRPLVVPVREASLEEEAEGSVLVRFVLPPGSFATMLLERLMGGPVR